ncbi:MAG: methyltransferase domain-containing protein [Fimbriimonadaceae bacterium]
MGRLIVLSHYQAAELLNARGQTQAEVSLDLGLTRDVVALDSAGVSWEGRRLDWKQLEKIKKSERKCFRWEEDGLHEIRILSEETAWVRSLAPTPSAPTMLVSGFPMHRIKDTDPWRDTEAKIKACGKIHGRVLDTATGLGYTAVLAGRKADSVVTIDIDPAGIEIARQNPWSQELFDNPKIEQRIGDVVELVQEFAAGEFSLVIHDPPTVQFAGEMYSEEFYRSVYRVVSRTGKFFHYIGDPKSGLGSRMTEGVMKRLKAAGFKKVTRQPDAFGVLAEK